MTSLSPLEVTSTKLSDQDHIDLLNGLVAIPSLSGREGDAVSYLCQQVEARGFRAHRDKAGSAVGVIGDGPKTIVLLGHIDTVPGDIPVGIENGVLHGRGAVDAKGPLAAFVAAAANAAERLNATVTVVGAVGEETLNSPGATAVATWPAPDFCVIGEPSGWDAVCLGYRGTMPISYRLRQASRHAAGPGESVGEQAIAFWNAFAAACSARNEGVSGLFNAITPSIRSISTEGDGLYDDARLSIGLRLPPGVDISALQSEILALAGEAEISFDGVQEGYRSDNRSPLVPPFLRAIRAAGGEPRFTVKLGTSDMTVVGPVWKCPIVAYGPGDASLDHTPDEHIVLDDYLRGVSVLTEVLAAL
jgi:LysW-gamma-L-lysine carboxypeptidase